MKEKIQKATSYYLKYRNSFDNSAFKSAFKKEAANYFADSYEEYLILLNHLNREFRDEAVAVPHSEPVLVVPPGCHYWGGKIRNNAEWRRRW